MEEKSKFLKELNHFVSEIHTKGDSVTVNDVKTHFKDMNLNKEQLELVFDYLLAQKIVVKGYLKMNPSAPELEANPLTEEEEAYLKEYQEELDPIKILSEEERQELFQKLLDGDTASKNPLIEAYLPEVVTIAKQMHHPDIFLGDLIQEGNLGLLIGLDMLTDATRAHAMILEQIRQNMQLLIEEHTELKKRDSKMVEKVAQLDEAIKDLTEELGHKVTIDELAVYLGMTEDEIEDILKLTGDDSEETD